MRTATRYILTFMAMVASYSFCMLLPFSIITVGPAMRFLPLVVSILLAVAVGVFVWKRSGTLSNNFKSTVLMGGILLGSVGFLAGFFGPMVFMPDANQGPLLGIFFTGPIGFVVGLLGGALFWVLKARHR